MNAFQKFIIAALILIPAIVLTGVLFKNRAQLSGLKPALLPSQQNIAELIENSPGVNNTDFPLIVAEGFTVSIFAKDLGDPRVLTIDPMGRVLTSTPKSNKVVALEDTNTDGVADKTLNVASNLDRPHGLYLDCPSAETCELYIAEVTQVNKYSYDVKTATVSNKQLYANLPGGGRHNTRTLLPIEIDGKQHFLITVGSACDVCYESNPVHGTIQLANADSTETELYASGLRNAVFMAKHPISGKVWATEMGRDQLGDDLPPDEVNIIEQGSNYGWPECYGNNMLDTKFSSNRAQHCDNKIPAYIQLQAHSAPLGLAFVPNEGWPTQYQSDLFVVYHGSWNRTEPVGYKVERIELDENGIPTGERFDFISGWLQNNGTSLGRPVDILPLSDGISYISDDKAGVIYRVSSSSQE